MSYDDRNSLRPGGNRFVRNRVNGKIFGVCAGIADYFDIDVTLVRVGFVLGTIFGVGSLVVVYLAIALLSD